MMNSCARLALQRMCSFQGRRTNVTRQQPHADADEREEDAQYDCLNCQNVVVQNMNPRTHTQEIYQHRDTLPLDTYRMNIIRPTTEFPIIVMDLHSAQNSGDLLLQ
jgi:hypothetical protein